MKNTLSSSISSCLIDLMPIAAQAITNGRYITDVKVLIVISLPHKAPSTLNAIKEPITSLIDVFYYLYMNLDAVHPILKIEKCCEGDCAPPRPRNQKINSESFGFPWERSHTVDPQSYLLLSQHWCTFQERSKTLLGVENLNRPWSTKLSHFFHWVQRFLKHTTCENPPYLIERLMTNAIVGIISTWHPVIFIRWHNFRIPSFFREFQAFRYGIFT